MLNLSVHPEDSDRNVRLQTEAMMSNKQGFWVPPRMFHDDYSLSQLIPLLDITFFIGCLTVEILNSSPCNG